MESSEPSVGHRLRKPGAVVEADYLPRPPTTPEVQDPAARPRPLALRRSGRVSSACCGAGPYNCCPERASPRCPGARGGASCATGIRSRGGRLTVDEEAS